MVISRFSAEMLLKSCSTLSFLVLFEHVFRLPREKLQNPYINLCVFCPFSAPPIVIVALSKPVPDCRFLIIFGDDFPIFSCKCGRTGRSGFRAFPRLFSRPEKYSKYDNNNIGFLEGVFKNTGIRENVLNPLLPVRPLLEAFCVSRPAARSGVRTD